MEDLTWSQIATDFAVSAGLSAILYGAMGFVGVSVGTAVADPLVGAILGVLVAGYVSYRTYDWAIEKIEDHFYKWRLMDLAVEQAGHLIGGIVGGLSIGFSVSLGI
jgi:hypothetical protein